MFFKLSDFETNQSSEYSYNVVSCGSYCDDTSLAADKLCFILHSALMLRFIKIYTLKIFEIVYIKVRNKKGNIFLKAKHY